MNGISSRGGGQNVGARRALPGRLARRGLPLQARPATAGDAGQDGWLGAGPAELATFAVAFGLATGGFLSRTHEAAAAPGAPHPGFWFTARELPWTI